MRIVFFCATFLLQSSIESHKILSFDRVNTLSDDKTVDWTQLKEFADDKLNIYTKW